ncbi:41943_t:CDS:2, partial [Gigaspora margarita]
MTDPAWDEFKKYPPNTPIRTSTQRLHAHLNSCQKYQNFLTLNQNEPTISNSLPVTITQKNPNLPIDLYLSCQLNPIEQKTIDKKIAHAFYSCGILYALIKNNFFIVALKLLHPTYNPLSHWQLSNNLLSNEYKETKDQVQQIYSKEKFISISTDGWSNQYNKSIINYMTLTTHGPIFFKSTVTKTQSHMAEYITEGIQKGILEFFEFKENFWARNTLEIASKITNYFNSHQVVKAHLSEAKKQEINKTIALVNSVKTRWGTQLTVHERLLESKSSIQ